MPNLLIIDDDRAHTETLTDIFQEEGLKVASATTGHNGIEYVKREKFQVIILDLKLPDRNGLDILKELLSLDAGGRIIVITGFATTENAIRALNEGASYYITKPFDIDELKALVRKAIAQSQLATEKKIAETEIIRLKEYNENILASLPYALIIFDRSLKIEYVNSVYLRDFSLKREMVIGKNLFETLALIAYQTEIIQKDVDNFLSGTPQESRKIKIDDRMFGYHLFYVLKGASEVQKTGLIMRDITSEIKVQQQLIQSEKLAGIGTMASGIAHEVNNPLFGVMGMAEAILDEEDPHLIKEYARDIVNYSKQAAAVVKGLNIYARSTQAGDFKLIDVNENLDEALKIVRHSIELDRIDIAKDYKANEKILINSGELQQVFGNIIRNAAQAMNGKGRLEISTRNNEDSVLIKISDSGPGIPKAHLGKIFDPFFTTKDPGKGTGLGLNIVHRIVRNYDGMVEVESEEGKGATFTIKFPIKK